jgi:hypothetical protein
MFKSKILGSLLLLIVFIFGNGCSKSFGDNSKNNLINSIQKDQPINQYFLCSNTKKIISQEDIDKNDKKDTKVKNTGKKIKEDEIKKDFGNCNKINYSLEFSHKLLVQKINNQTMLFPKINDFSNSEFITKYELAKGKNTNNRVLVEIKNVTENDLYINTYTFITYLNKMQQNNYIKLKPKGVITLQLDEDNNFNMSLHTAI